MELNDDIKQSNAVRELIKGLNTINNIVAISRIQLPTSKEDWDENIAIEHTYNDNVRQAVDKIDDSLKVILKFNKKVKEPLLKKIAEQLKSKLQYQTPFDKQHDKWAKEYQKCLAFNDFKFLKCLSLIRDTHGDLEIIHSMVEARRHAYVKTNRIFNDAALQVGIDKLKYELPSISIKGAIKCYEVLVDTDQIADGQKDDFMKFIGGKESNKPLKWLGKPSRLCAFIKKIMESTERAHEFHSNLWEENVLPNFVDEDGNPFGARLKDAAPKRKRNGENTKSLPKYDEIEEAYNELVSN